MMEDSDRRIAPLAAYAALICGAAFACLVLFSSPASAEGSEPPAGSEESSLLGLQDVGDRVTDATRDLGRDAAELTREVAETAPVVQPVVEPVVDDVTEEVVAVTDAVADRVDTVVEVVDQPVPPLPEAPQPAVPDSEPAPETDAEPTPVPSPGPAATPTRSTAEPRAERARPARAEADVRPRAERPTRGFDRLRAPMPTLTSTLRAGPATAPATVPEESSRLVSLDTVAGCGDCAASGSASGDPLHVFGLPSQGVTTPRSADSVPRDAVVGGPTTIFHRPDVSPD